MGMFYSVDEVMAMAEQIERNGAAFYTRAAQVVHDPATSELLARLADWERGHERLFARMRAEMAARIEAAGGKVHTGITVTAVERTADGAFRVRTQPTPPSKEPGPAGERAGAVEGTRDSGMRIGGERVFEGGRVVSTIPGSIAAGIGSSGEGGEGMVYGPVVEGYLLPDSPLALIERGEHNDVPFVLGSTADNFTPRHAIRTTNLVFEGPTPRSTGNPFAWAAGTKDDVVMSPEGPDEKFSAGEELKGQIPGARPHRCVAGCLCSKTTGCCGGGTAGKSSALEAVATGAMSPGYPRTRWGYHSQTSSPVLDPAESPLQARTRTPCQRRAW